MRANQGNEEVVVAGRSAHEAPSFSVANRLARVLWNATALLLFRPTPRPLHAWRSFLLRLFGAKIGRNCHIYPGAKIWAPWNLACGDDCGVASGATLYNQALISIGSRAVISQGAHLCCGTHNYESRLFELQAFSISIGADAWVCAEAFVGPGVTIGEGAVIGARAVVLKDMPAWTVCGGHPCKPLRPYTRE
ncbi:MAG TPA: putative colanic acid biosynthesis acetyltransferase [Methylomirabilota bacterium]|nr:putative colanic acid biosynthesis acetyltransferase [Methylomirabilota bacterium]